LRLAIASAEVARIGSAVRIIASSSSGARTAFAIATAGFKPAPAPTAAELRSY